MGLGLALAGGGCRGAAHVGILLALEESGIKITSVAGTSAGALVGGMYSAGVSCELLIEIIGHLEKEGGSYLDFNLWQLLKAIPQLIFKDTLTLKGLIKGNRLLEFFRDLTGDKKMRDLKLMTVIPAVDLTTGDTIVFTNTEYHALKRNYTVWDTDLKACEAMMASASVPAVFMPRTIGSFCLVDGGVTHNLPVDLLNMTGEKNIIAVDISADYVTAQNPTIIDIVTQSFSIMSDALKDCSTTRECFLLKPPLPKEAGLLTFGSMSSCMSAAYEYTQKMIPQIRRWLSH